MPFHTCQSKNEPSFRTEARKFTSYLLRDFDSYKARKQTPEIHLGKPAGIGHINTSARLSGQPGRYFLQVAGCRLKFTVTVT